MKVRAATYIWIGTNCRKFLAVKGPDSATTKAAGIDHILDAQKKGEIEELNVICMIENVNAAGTTILTYMSPRHQL